MINFFNKNGWMMIGEEVKVLQPWICNGCWLKDKRQAGAVGGADTPCADYSLCKSRVITV